MKAFITGITGFVGGHLTKHLLDLEYAVSGTYIEESHRESFPYTDKTDLVELNLLDADRTLQEIADKKPDMVFHLAALSSTAESFSDPAKTLTNNIVAQINLLEAILKTKLEKTKILVVSSSDIYGAVEKSGPINEETPMKPTNAYAVSKMTQDFLGLQYCLAFNMQIIRVRPFNHIGPGQSPHFVVASFAKRIAEIEKGKKEPVLPVGNIESKRDFTDVRDVVKAYELLIQKGENGEVYNVGSGKSYKIADILDKLLSMTNKTIDVKVDESLLRPVDVADFICDSSKIFSETGWKPEISINSSLKDTLDYWRNII